MPRLEQSVAKGLQLSGGAVQHGGDLSKSQETSLKLKHLAAALSSLLLLASTWSSAVASEATPAQTPEASASALFETVAALDADVFKAFNSCADPEQLQRHAAYFSEAVEFYHDQGGVTWTRAEMLANTKKHVCGKFRRELVLGSLRVYPIKGFGAIAQGVHRFCQFGADTCEGAADFLIVWRHEGSQWSITRVLSYGHRPN